VLQTLTPAKNNSRMDAKEINQETEKTPTREVRRGETRERDHGAKETGARGKADRDENPTVKVKTTQRSERAYRRRVEVGVCHGLRVEKRRRHQRREEITYT